MNKLNKINTNFTEFVALVEHSFIYLQKIISRCWLTSIFLISLAVLSVIEVVKCEMFDFFLLVCPSGYYGPNCSLKCRPPSFGIKCQLECECREQDCDHISGCRQFSM